MIWDATVRRLFRQVGPGEMPVRFGNRTGRRDTGRASAVCAAVAAAVLIVPAERSAAMDPETEGVTITGRYVGMGVTCPQFQLDSGEIISLSGRPPELVAGARLTLTGRWTFDSNCMQGRDFRITGGERYDPE